uniref:TonB-dependent hemoglobin/transferrin/lactoferrin family receptor (Transferrin-binding protein A) (Vep20) n=1 Tax=Ganoderma boninense TaxID=34458 RepID=A0A5K1JUN8_9APHY|nr:TonB-dependent hemoglobin/transferrin/lactoferrin family receptor (Transferrin-binding protein A) (Vep20) [Ganoderma boninense]
MHFSYHALVTNYLDPKALGKTVWSLDFFMIAGGFSQIATYSFFIRRVSFIGKSFKHVALLAAVCLAIDLGFSIGEASRTRSHLRLSLIYTSNPSSDDRQRCRPEKPGKFLSAAAHKQNILVHGKFAAASATHALLTGSLMYALCWGLKAKARKESLARHKSVADWCSLYVVNTGAGITTSYCSEHPLQRDKALIIRSVFSVSDVVSWILAATLPGTVWWAALSMVTVKLSDTALLADSLNSRRLLTETGITIFGPGAGADSGSAMALSLSLPSGRNFILRAQRSATAERSALTPTPLLLLLGLLLLARGTRYKLPERAPTRIDIKVATEVEEGDGGSPTGGRTSHSSVIGIGEGKAA